MDQIIIRRLKVFAHHGVYAEETVNGQTFYVNAILYGNLRHAGITDDLMKSTDYGEVCHFITEYLQKHTYQLIEAASENTAASILRRFPLIDSIDFELSKPYAPVGLPLEDISVRIVRGWHRVTIALGSNIGDKAAYLNNAVLTLRSDENFRNIRCSSFIRTAPYGGVEQEDFLNGVLTADTLYSPEELLDQLHEIENAAGRKRDIHWGPRTLDLDIISYDDMVMYSENLIIPHADMHNREFVLIPLCEIDPYWFHPALHKTAKTLLDDLKRGEQ